jgi:hypothetical protein
MIVRQLEFGAASAGEDMDGSDDAPYLTALVADYTALRQERQNDYPVFAALLSVSFVLVTLLLGLLSQTCPHLPSLNSCRPQIWQPAYAFLPMAVLAVLAVFMEFSNILVLRSYYMRAVEQELRELGSAPVRSFRDSNPMRYPSFGQLVDSAVFSPRTGFLRYQVLHGLMVATFVVITIPTVLLCLLVSGPVDLQVVMGVVYAAAIAFLFRMAWATTIGGERFWRDSTVRLGLARPDVPHIGRGERSLSSYVVLPRPVDLVQKGPVTLLAWVLGGAVLGTFDWSSLGDLLTAVVIFELLLYQARYVINDLRGLDVDGEYSAFKQRTRFPRSSGRPGVQAALISVDRPDRRCSLVHGTRGRPRRACAHTCRGWSPDRTHRSL